jgi:hypothetical protein
MISVIVNGKNVELFNNDTDKTFLERVASNFRIHPNFFKQDINIKELKNEDDIKINTLIGDIQNYKYKSNLTDNVNFIKYLIDNYQKVDKDDVVKLFLSVNNFFSKPVDDIFDMSELIPLTEKLKENGIIIDTSKFLKKEEDYKSEKDIFMEKMKESINRINEESRKFTSLNKKLLSIKSVVKNVKDLEIKKDDCDLKLTTNIKESEYSLSSVFSNIICKENTPFLSYDNIYKIYQDLDIKIPDDWSISFSNFMILKVHIDNEKYADCNFYFENNLLIIMVELHYKDFDNLSEEMVREIVKTNISFSLSNFDNFSIISELETNINETVIIENQTFNIYVLSDIVMNNNIFSNVLTVNESVQTTKKKSGLYLHYFIENSKGTCNITTAEDISTIPVKNVVRLRIKKALNQDIANNFIILIGKLLAVYNNDDKSIISFYKKYIPSFPKEKAKKDILEIPKLTLQKQVPDLFISGYPYKCQYPPVIVSDEEAKEYTEERVMKYPIKGEGKPHNYVCKDEQKNEFVYIGLRENSLKNREKYKYIPCCFKSDQTQRKGTYLEYFKGEIIEKGPQQNIIITNKLVRPDEYGILPQNINKLLTSIDNSYSYLRKGVSPTSISFLDCVLEAVLDITDYSAMPLKSKERILYEHFNKLKEYNYLAVASQENPGQNENQLKKSFEYLDKKYNYMNPSRWIKLLETVYKCKIIIVSRDKNERSGIITIPNHDLFYLYEKYKSEQKVVMIYEHFGTEVNMKYPRCELIIKWDRELSLMEGTSNYFFGGLARNLYSFYTSLISQNSYSIFNKKLTNINSFDLQELRLLKPSYQIIDNYGKARGVVINNFILLSDPFPPIKAKYLEKDKIYKENDLNSIIEFFNSNNIQIQSQIIVNDIIKEINVLISGIVFTAKIGNSNKYIEDIKYEIIEKYPSINKNIQNNINFKRLSFIISEYFVYYYSHYINNIDKKSSLNTIKDFIKTKVNITNNPNQSKNYIIPNVPSISIDILNNNKFVIDNKFIVENQEILKRLIYTLHVKLETNYNNVLNYHKNSEIYGFYRETSHFSENMCNIIVKDINDLQKVDNVVYDKIQTDKLKFFMHNKLLFNDNPLLLLNTETKEEAFTISSNWIKYNKITDYDDPEPLENKKLYLYHSNVDIKLNKVIKDKNEPFSYALKYKKDDQDVLLSLAPL